MLKLYYCPAPLCLKGFHLSCLDNITFTKHLKSFKIYLFLTRFAQVLENLESLGI